MCTMKFRRFFLRFAGPHCMRSRSWWVDIVLAAMFVSLFIVVYQEQNEQALKADGSTSEKGSMVQIMDAAGKLIKVSDGGDGNPAWKAEQDKAASLIKPPIGEVRKKKYNVGDMAEAVGDKNILKNIQNILGQIPQNFGPVCRTASYPAKGQIPASIIVVFHDYQLYDLKVTMSSLQVNTPEHLIHEVIVIDDGSRDAKVIQDAKDYVDHLPKAKLVRNENHVGEALARTRAVSLAGSPRLVFLSTTVIVAPGWLEPLLDHVHFHPLTVAVPHLDKVFETFEKYESVPRTWVAVFFWSLAIKLSRVLLSEENVDILIGLKSPTVKGDIFAVTKDFVSTIGLYDPDFAGTGAEHVEMSLRTWMCHGMIKVLRCSHAGVLTFLDSVPVDEAEAAWRVAQLWMPDYVALAATLSGLHYNPTADDIAQVDKKKEELSKKCRMDIKWYIENVAKNMILPSKNAKNVGLFQVKNGFCANLQVNNTRLALEKCNHEIVGQSPQDMTFEYTDSGQIKVKGRCLASVDSYVMVEPCVDHDRQVWIRNTDGTFKCKADDMCMVHVSDPKLEHRGLAMQTIMAQACTKDGTDNKNFSSFMFIQPG